MTYAPNYQNPQVQRRIAKSLDWCNTYLTETKTHWLSQREIQRQFGSQSRPLGKYLRNTLLICVNPYYSNLTESVCKTYKLNIEGYLRLCTAFDYEPKFALNPKQQQQLESGVFDYNDTSDRSFNGIQFIPKKKRRTILENQGYRFHYDIEAAAPTLLLQRCQQLQTHHQIHSEDYKAKQFVALEYYINNRSEIRQKIANECQTNEKTIKEVITLALLGAMLSSNRHSSIFREINNDYALMTRLQNSKSLREILKDISVMWKILRELLPVRYLTDKNGKQRLRALTGGDKSGLYRSLEKQVGDVIRRSLRGSRCLWIHDGWSCDKVCDELGLISEVRRQTGFVIKLDREQFNQ
jgi:hypothetical protein